jgi:hypothetical protein
MSPAETGLTHPGARAISARPLRHSSTASAPAKPVDLSAAFSCLSHARPSGMQGRAVSLVCVPSDGGSHELKEWGQETSVLSGDHLPEGVGDLESAPGTERAEKWGSQLGWERQGQVSAGGWGLLSALWGFRRGHQGRQDWHPGQPQWPPRDVPRPPPWQTSWRVLAEFAPEFCMWLAP